MPKQYKPARNAKSKSGRSQRPRKNAPRRPVNQGRSANTAPVGSFKRRNVTGTRDVYEVEGREQIFSVEIAYDAKIDDPIVSFGMNPRTMGDSRVAAITATSAEYKWLKCDVEVQMCGSSFTAGAAFFGADRDVRPISFGPGISKYISNLSRNVSLGMWQSATIRMPPSQRWFKTDAETNPENQYENWFYGAIGASVSNLASGTVTCIGYLNWKVALRGGKISDDTVERNITLPDGTQYNIAADGQLRGPNLDALGAKPWDIFEVQPQSGFANGADTQIPYFVAYNGTTGTANCFDSYHAASIATGGGNVVGNATDFNTTEPVLLQWVGKAKAATSFFR